jgi:hypothetical protein
MAPKPRAKREDDRQRRPCAAICSCDRCWTPDPAAEKAADAWWAVVDAEIEAIPPNPKGTA